MDAALVDGNGMEGGGAARLLGNAYQGARSRRGGGVMMVSDGAGSRRAGRAKRGWERRGDDRGEVLVEVIGGRLLDGAGGDAGISDERPEWVRLDTLEETAGAGGETAGWAPGDGTGEVIVRRDGKRVTVMPQVWQGDGEGGGRRGTVVSGRGGVGAAGRVGGQTRRRF